MRNFMNKNIFKSTLFYSFSGIICILIISYVICHPYYQTNDDVVMKMIASGNSFAFQSPNEHLIYINILYGKALKFLYIHFSSFEWYDIFFSVLTSISGFAIIHSLVRLAEKAVFKVFVTLSLICTLPLFFINVQFTQVASMLAISAVLTFISLILKKPKRIIFSLIGILNIFFAITFSALVRIESTFMILTYSFIPTILTIFYNKREDKLKTVLYMTSFYICSILLSAALFYVNFYQYSIDKDWKEHYLYNIERVKLIEYNNYLNYQETYRKQFKKQAKNNLGIPNEVMRKELLNNYSKNIWSSDLDALFPDDRAIPMVYILPHLSKNKKYVTIDEIKQDIINYHKKCLNESDQFDLNYMYLTMQKENEIKNQLAQVGWTKNDYQFLHNIYAVKNERFSLSHFRKANKLLYTSNYKKQKFATSYKELNKFFADNAEITILQILILLLFSSMFFDKKRFAFSILTIIQYFVFLLIILFTSKYPPYRVFISLFLFNFYYILLFFINDENKRIYSTKKQILNFIIPLLCLFVLFLIPTVRLASKREKLYNEYQNTIRYIQNGIEQKRNVVVFGAAFEYENSNRPFEKLLDFNKKFEGFGWMSYTPDASKYFMKKYHTLDFLPQLCDDKSYIIANEEPMNVYRDYIKRLYGQDMLYKNINKFSNVYTCKIQNR